MSTGPGTENARDQLRKARRARAGGSGLMARGEPAIWLTGGALALCLSMVVGLLALVIIQGVGTFWPGELLKIETVDGSVYLGTLSRREQFRMSGNDLKRLQGTEGRQNSAAIVTERFASESKAPDGAGGGAPGATGQTDGALPDDADRTITLERRLLRTGNFLISGEHFNWVEEFAIAKVETPEWAVLVERRENGHFYGDLLGYVEVEPWEHLSPEQRQATRPEDTVIVKRGDHGTARVAFGEAGSETILHRVTKQWTSQADAWLEYERRRGDALRRFAQRRKLEAIDIGYQNRLKEAARLAVAEARLNHGADAPEVQQALEAQAKVDEAAQAAIAAIKQQIDQLNAANEDNGLLLAPARGDLDAPYDVQQFLPIGDVVRALTPNRLSFGDKVGIYRSRWWEFLSDEPREANSEGGVLPAIFGTVMLTMIMCLVVVPFGVLAALYLREYAKAGFVVSAVRIAVNNLAGVPSIVFGVFGLGFFCYGFGKYVDGGPDQLGFSAWTPGVWLGGCVGLLVLMAGACGSGYVSWRHRRQLSDRQQAWIGRFGVLLWLGAGALLVLLLLHTPYFTGLFRAKLIDTRQPTFGTGGILWASLTLALLTLPVVIVATEEALAAVPGSMREGSYACGASKWQTIRRIVLPRAMPGIMTGMILAMARGAGEVAPLMIVGAVKLAPELPIDSVFPYVHPQRSFMHLGFHIYDVGFQSQNSEAAKPMVFTTTLLLIAIIATLNVAAIWLRARLRQKFRGTHI